MEGRNKLYISRPRHNHENIHTLCTFEDLVFTHFLSQANGSITRWIYLSCKHQRVRRKTEKKKNSFQEHNDHLLNLLSCIFVVLISFISNIRQRIKISSSLFHILVYMCIRRINGIMFDRI